MLAYKTIQDIAKDKQMSMSAVNNRLKIGKIIKISIKSKRDGEIVDKKVGYVLTKEALKQIVETL